MFSPHDDSPADSAHGLMVSPAHPRSPEKLARRTWNRRRRQSVLLDHIRVTVLTLSLEPPQVELEIRAPFGLRVLPADRIPCGASPRTMRKEIGAQRRWKLICHAGERFFIQSARHTQRYAFLSILHLKAHDYCWQGQERRQAYVKLAVDAPLSLSVASGEQV